MNGWKRTLSRGAFAGALLLAGVGGAHAAGALAVGACGAYGAAFDYSRDNTARTAALGKCNGNCTVVSAMKHNCAAFAIDGHKPCGPLGYAAGPKLGQAQNSALQFCYQYGGKDCVIRAWACDAKG